MNILCLVLQAAADFSPTSEGLVLHGMARTQPAKYGAAGSGSMAARDTEAPARPGDVPRTGGRCMDAVGHFDGDGWGIKERVAVAGIACTLPKAVHPPEAVHLA